MYFPKTIFGRFVCFECVFLSAPGIPGVGLMNPDVSKGVSPRGFAEITQEEKTYPAFILISLSTAL